MMRPIIKFALVLGLAGSVSGVALAQSGSAGKSQIARLLERVLSSPDRKVEINGLEGAFSSTVKIANITVSDRQGPWLKLDGASMTWSRAALLRKRLDIQNLTANEIDVLRKPAPSETTTSSGGGFSLPIAVNLDQLSVPKIAIGEPVFGTAANLSLEGSAHVTSSAVQAKIDGKRLDAPGGTLSLDVNLDPNKNSLLANVRFDEPAGGLVSKALKLPGEPAVVFTLQGQGPLDNWQGNVDLQENAKSILGGSIGIARPGTGYRITSDLTGSLGQIAPANYASLLKGDSHLALDLTKNDDGSILLNSLALKSSTVDLTGTARVGSDKVPQAADIHFVLGSSSGDTELPFVPGQPKLRRIDMNASLQAGSPSPWRVNLTAERVQTTYGSLGHLQLQGSGEASDWTSATDRGATFTANVNADGIEAADPDLAAAIGSRLTASTQGRWHADQPVNFADLRVALDRANASFVGTAAPERINGTYTLIADDLSRFARLAKRDIGGSAQLTATGSVRPKGGYVDLNLKGSTQDLHTGVASLDPILKGQVQLSGEAWRSRLGLRLDNMQVTARTAQASLTGLVSAPHMNIDFDTRVQDLAVITPRAKGAAHLSGHLGGSQAAPEVDVTASGTDVVLMDRPLKDPRAHFVGTIAGPNTRGDATLNATLGNTPIQGSGHLSGAADGSRHIENLAFNVGDTKLAGDVTMLANNLFSGKVSLHSPDLSVVGPLFLQNAKGSLDADLNLAVNDNSQSAQITGKARNIAVENVRVGSADIQAQGDKLTTQPALQGTFDVRNVSAGGLQIVQANGSASRQGQNTDLTVDGKLADGAAHLKGSLAPAAGGLDVSLAELRFQRAGVNVALARPTAIQVRNGTANLHGATINVGSGRIVLDGRAGQQMALDVTLSSLPAALANTFQPSLGATGTISGKAHVTGTAAAPAATYDASWTGASVQAARSQGVGPLNIGANGRFNNGTLDTTVKATGAGGLTLNAQGSVAVKAGNRIDMRVNGAVPLTLANAAVADRGAALKGILRIDATVRGTPAALQYSGTVTADGASVVDPLSGITLNGLSLRASLNNDRLVLDRLTARSSPNGSLAASGTIGLRGDLPVNIRANSRGLRYSDGSLVVATFDSDLTLTGSVKRGMTAGGLVQLRRVEVTIPEQLPGGSVAVQIEHRHTPPDVRKTIARAMPKSRPKRGNSAASASVPVALNLTVDAPSQIFVRGRGLDAELGGRLTLRGTTAAIVTEGQFELRRGRLDVLTQRISLDRGTITFQGDFDPMLDFSASTTGNNLTVTILITGNASNPEVKFTSSPELPQDEVLAQLIFKRSLSDLSPFQVAQLAAAAAQLAGGNGGGGIIDQLRQSTGLDELDVTTDAQGNASLRAGRYINERTYLGVQQSAGGGSEVTVDLDITRNIKARAGAGNDDTSAGLFYEKEY
ncbi:autotransporter secretion inner membrane protein TamB [Faunimonas pinastri]|uniref:Autotransporter secretion inner membrane protein TamB n=1 Tax=Faunimonas pinastri TaxID=1855383 RepID=A0A1H9D5Z1_9HYPH|nr:translocation/assembly module TamB domain-containing protein [Faunimonas pinastri]SEQ08875.1 autotransporter secretion inner membrane protein TamB [Faunimonas pinastri]